MDSSPSLDKLRISLKDIAPSTPPGSLSFENLVTKISEPPSYMVQILLFGVLRLPNYGPLDKVRWHTFVSYKNRDFMVRDYKFGTWSIEGTSDNISTKLALHLRNKIVKGCIDLDMSLCAELQEEVAKGNYYLNNAYSRLLQIVAFYEKRISEALAAYDEGVERMSKLKLDFSMNMKKVKESEKEIESEVLGTDLVNYLNDWLTLQKSSTRPLTNYSIALIYLYFSLIEFLLEAFYAFEQTKAPLAEFKKMKWDEKFRLLLPIENFKELGNCYNSLIKIKRDYRNPLAHGLADEAGRLVYLPEIGLVPLSYKYLSKKLNYPDVEMSKDDVTKILQIFHNFLAFIKKHKPYTYYLEYLSLGFAILMSSERIDEIRSKMTSDTDFANYLEILCERADRFSNYDD